jgi:hypothetical protein
MSQFDPGPKCEGIWEPLRRRRLAPTLCFTPSKISPHPHTGHRSPRAAPQSKRDEQRLPSSPPASPSLLFPF